MKIFKAQPGSPVFSLVSEIDQATGELTINEDIKQVPDPPNLLTIYDGDSFETILYKGIEENDNKIIDLERGYEGEAQSWEAGTELARLMTAYDLDCLQQSITNIIKPGPISNLQVIAAQNQKAALSFDIAGDSYYGGTRLVYKTDSYPEDIDDGNVIEDYKSGDIIEGLTNDTEFYLRLFPYYTEGNFNDTSEGQQITATPVAGPPGPIAL